MRVFFNLISLILLYFCSATLFLINIRHICCWIAEPSSMEYFNEVCIVITFSFMILRHTIYPTIKILYKNLNVE